MDYNNNDRNSNEQFNNDRIIVIDSNDKYGVVVIDSQICDENNGNSQFKQQ